VEYTIYLAMDGSWGIGPAINVNGNDITDEEMDILENGSDADREELYYKWGEKEK
jgi:hypothetical protein